MKPLVYIPATNGIDLELPYGIKTWEFYCKKHELELFVQNNNHVSYGLTGHWQPWFDMDILNEDWDRILIVDADTMIRWNTPNIFPLFEGFPFCAVLDIENKNNTGEAHLSQWPKCLTSLTPNARYFNSGFLYMNRDSYLLIRDEIQDGPYLNHYRFSDPRPNGFEQTPVNIIAHDFLEVKYLDNIWNNMVGHYKDNESFVNHSFIWHFTVGKYLKDESLRSKDMKHIYELWRDKYDQR